MWFCGIWPSHRRAAPERWGHLLLTPLLYSRCLCERVMLKNSLPFFFSPSHLGWPGDSKEANEGILHDVSALPHQCQHSCQRTGYDHPQIFAFLAYYIPYSKDKKHHWNKTGFHFFSDCFFFKGFNSLSLFLLFPFFSHRLLRSSVISCSSLATRWCPEAGNTWSPWSIPQRTRYSRSSSPSFWTMSSLTKMMKRIAQVFLTRCPLCVVI